MAHPVTTKRAMGVALASSLCIAFAVLWAWFVRNPGGNLEVRLPGKDGRPADSASRRDVTDMKGRFQRFDGVAADLPGAWTRFRGADFDNIVKDGAKLADSWAAGSPKILWRVGVGEGYAAPVVLGGRVYLLDYDEKIKGDAIRCFSLADGKEIWRRAYVIPVKRNHGMSRTIPAVTDKYLVTIGPRCHVVCLDPTTGDYKWGIDLQHDYGAKEPLWYTGQCPVIDDNKVILAPCGKDVLLMAVDCETGAPVWKTPNPKHWDMSHSSIMPMTFGGKKMYVYCAIGGVAGVSAEPADAGALLWTAPWGAKVIAPSPVCMPDGKILLVAGYGEGSMMLQLKQDGNGFAADVVYKKAPKDGLTCEQHTPIFFKGLLYGVMPKDAGELKSQFVCYKPEGALVWSSGPDRRFGLGPFILADGKFYILNDDATLTMIQADTEGYKPLGEAKILPGHEAWGPFAVAGDRMLFRESKEMLCIAVGASEGASK